MNAISHACKHTLEVWEDIVDKLEHALGKTCTAVFGAGNFFIEGDIPIKINVLRTLQIAAMIMLALASVEFMKKWIQN